MDLQMPTRRDRAGVGFRMSAVAAVAALVIAGCGGSSTPSTTTTKKKTTPTTTVSKPVSVTMTKPSSSSSGGSTSTGSSSSSSNTPSFASVGNCSSLAGVGTQFAKAMSAASSGGKYNLNAAMAAYQHLADTAPSGLKPYLETIAHVMSSYISALDKSGWKPGTVPSATQIAAIESAAKSFSAPDLIKASKAAEAWAVQNCHA